MTEVKDVILKASPYYKSREKKAEQGLISHVPDAEHKIIYDSSTETLEPIYFYIVDLMGDLFAGSQNVQKLVDNFVSSPGSGHFAELGQRATVMQQQGTKLLADANTVLRSVLNLIYDLKEFKIRLQSYDDLHAKEKDKRDAARLSLKQLWMDKVDMQKGNSSIKGMALSQAGFQTLLDAFLVAKDEKDVDKIDLNDRVKRILKPRVQEFNIWVKQSEKELRKRYELEKTYLKSQVNSLKLYSRWAKPYLNAAQQLQMSEGGKSPALVKAFNTIMLELSIFGKSEVEPPKESVKTKPKRKYYKCTLVDFRFRGIPQRVAQQSHYAFGGRAEVVFRGYALNEDELKKLEQELDKSDMDDMFALISGTTEESLEQLHEEIEYFLGEESREEETKKPTDTSNPFKALIGGYNKKEKKNDKDNKNKEENKIEKVKPDDWVEKTFIRPNAIKQTKQVTFDIFNIYKKAHSMPNFDWFA